MKITRTSQFTKRLHTMDLDVTTEQLAEHENGVSAQRAFPNLSAPEREFLLTGVTPEEWAATFGD